MSIPHAQPNTSVDRYIIKSLVSKPLPREETKWNTQISLVDRNSTITQLAALLEKREALSKVPLSVLKELVEVLMDLDPEKITPCGFYQNTADPDCPLEWNIRIKFMDTRYSLDRAPWPQAIKLIKSELKVRAEASIAKSAFRSLLPSYSDFIKLPVSGVFDLIAVDLANKQQRLK